MRYVYTMLLLLVLVSHADAQQWYLLDSDLNTITLRDVVVTGNNPLQTVTPQIIGTDPQGAQQKVPLTRVVRMSRQALSAPLPPETSMVELNDGQRLLGVLRTTQDSETLNLDHPELGRLLVPLAQIKRLQVTLSASRHQPDANFDQILFRNQDELRGTLLGITGNTALLLLPNNQEPLSLPIENIAEILRPVSEPASSNHDRIILTDGTIIHATRLLLARQELRLQPVLGTQSITLPEESIRQIDFRSHGLHLVPITRDSLHIQQKTLAFGIEIPPHTSPLGLHLHAPATLVQDLPPNTIGIIVRGKLDPSIPEKQLPWPDINLTISAHGIPESNVLVDEHNPEFSFTIPVPHALDGQEIASQLKLSLGAAQRGPVLDRLLITQAEFLTSDTALQAPSETLPDTELP